MGRGIRTKDGDDPLVAWQGRLLWFGDDDLTAALRSLLGGRPVVSQDRVLEISVMPLATPGASRVSVLRPGAPYVADLVVSAWDGGASPDPRTALPAPDQWRHPDGAGQVRWELFNCVLHTLRSREDGSGRARGLRRPAGRG
ncbi:hypothetical protein [Aquipuribacter sp. MA13-6]|uniref:hypothetical protein n=1 Tax=unclassified Aquipuribacter TaxID=2635084 RepID=UPI003EEBB662